MIGVTFGGIWRGSISDLCRLAAPAGSLYATVTAEARTNETNQRARVT